MAKYKKNNELNYYFLFIYFFLFHKVQVEQTGFFFSTLKNVTILKLIWTCSLA